MNFFTSMTEKIGGLFSAPETKSKKEAKKIITISEHAASPSAEHESTYSQKDVVISMDRTQRSDTHTHSDRQEVAKLTNEIFTELKNIQKKQKELTKATVLNGGEGLLGGMDAILRTGSGHLMGSILWGESALIAHQAVQTEAFANLLGNMTAIGAVVATTLLSYKAIKSVAETADYFFRGECSKRKELERARNERKHFKNERKLMAKEYRDGRTSAEEYIHYASQLVSDVRTQEEIILNGGQHKNSISPPITGMKESMKQDRRHALERTIGAAIAAPVVNVLFGQQLGINEWDMVTPSHRVEATLSGIQFYSTKVADAVGTHFKGAPYQAWNAFAIGATALIGKTIQDAAVLAKKFDKREQEERIIKEMENSIKHMKELEGRIGEIAEQTPFKGKKRLNAEHVESLRRKPPQSAPNDFSDLAVAVEKNIADEQRKQERKTKAQTFFDKVLGRGTQATKPAAETSPLTVQDFGESPSLFRTECLRKAIGIILPPGTLLSQDTFMGFVENWLRSASDLDVIDRELYFSSQQHQNNGIDADESIGATLDEAARRCAAERLNRIQEKTAYTAFDPNTLRARLLTLLGMEDEVAVGQKYFEKLFAQGYAQTSRLNRIYFNEIVRALDLSLNISDVSRKREKNSIFESMRDIITKYENAQAQAA